MLLVYTGKRIRHTIKTRIATNKDRLIVHKSKSVEGKNTITLSLKQPPPIPEDVETYVDLNTLERRIFQK